MKSFHYKNFHFWGTEYRKNIFQKWYDGFIGLNLFGRKFFGFWFQDNNLVVNFKTKPFQTKRNFILLLYLIHWVFKINLINISKSKYCSTIKKETYTIDEKLKWYEGFTGIIILDTKFLGFTISDKNYSESRNFWIFLYIFGFTISIDIIGRIE